MYIVDEWGGIEEERREDAWNLAEVNSMIRDEDRPLVDLECMGCGKHFMGDLPRMCCSGFECGCMGLPVDPVCCSKECEDRIVKGL